MSDFVTWRDARGAFRLLDELKQLGHDTLAWRRHLLTGLSTLVGAQVGLSAETPEGGLLAPPRHLGAVDLGWGTHSDRRTWMQVCERPEAELDPSDERISALGVRSFTLHRRELASDQRWYKSIIFNEHYRPARLNHYLLSVLHVPEYRAMHFVFLFRAHSDRPFDERERQLVGHLHGELGVLWKEASEVQLPRRLQQTLSLFQAGCGEKEVADRLGLSPKTVHDYSKALHRRLKVRSRAELLAKAASLPRPPRLLMQDEDLAGPAGRV
ncbi:LuxR family transcriptional regulator [Myxococcus stipitatus DSM 14675]|uniref:LuxR family transcriptional regulator n=1 Tax=Myxococcus stipitatus (strain DSM 14675 / JCM 12634 / Mx s8) TaxID=1278073 RepID=L7U6Z6_MYXSD|nr:helix-turn-helix transcriptional regulator [Myxococcus stipitatus]AGC43342.1 LuxR family transcriptional regulator [Myxococcus stipitatus DSM 14675]